MEALGLLVSAAKQLRAALSAVTENDRQTLPIFERLRDNIHAVSGALVEGSRSLHMDEAFGRVIKTLIDARDICYKHQLRK